MSRVQTPVPETCNTEYGFSFFPPQLLQANISTGPQKRPRPLPCTYSPLCYALITLLYSHTNTASLEETRMWFCKSQLTQNLHYLSPDVSVFWRQLLQKKYSLLIFTNSFMCTVTYHRTYVSMYAVWNVWYLASGRFVRTEACCLHCI